MLIKFNEKLTLKTLRKLSKINKIKYVSKLDKYSVLLILNRHKAVVYIQKNFREKIMTTKICPICHEDLKYPFISFKINSIFFYYDFNTLISYFNKIRDFRDPLTRQVINENKINEINKLIKYYYGNNTNKILITEQMVKTTEVNIIIYCLYDLITEINNRSIINIDYIYNNTLGRLIYYFNKLQNICSNRQMISIIKVCKESFSTTSEHVKILYDYLDLILVLNSTP